jgi:hypothetical protein
VFPRLHICIHLCSACVYTSLRELLLLLLAAICKHPSVLALPVPRTRIVALESGSFTLATYLAFPTVLKAREVRYSETSPKFFLTPRHNSPDSADWWPHSSSYALSCRSRREPAPLLAGKRQNHRFGEMFIK